MIKENAIEIVRTKYKSLIGIMDERMRRHWAASEAKAFGWGGVSATSQATGLSRTTIEQGIKELEQQTETKAEEKQS